MILQVKFRPLVALACVFVFTPAIFIFMPQLMPFNKDVTKFIDLRTNNYVELQTLKNAITNTIFNYKTYIITGDEKWHARFNSSRETITHELSILKAMNASEQRNFTKIREFQNKAKDALVALAQEANLRPQQSQENATLLLESTKQLDTLEEIGRDVSLLQMSEYHLVKENLKIYQNTVEAGPYPWLALLLIFGISGLVAFGSGAQPAVEGEEENPYTSEKVKELTDELAEAKEQLERLTNLDELTEVLNLNGLEKILSVEENRMVRAGGHLISILINCDDFSKINKEFGHVQSDKILKDVAKRVVGTLRPSDHVARVEGDEFIVLLPDTQLAYGMRVAERIRVSVNDTPLPSSKKISKVTVSVGVATIPQTASTVEQLVSHAKGALKRSKDGGKDKVSLAKDVEQSEKSGEQKDLIEKLTDASSYRVVYQPILDLSNEEVAGFEILTRGLEGSFESPDQFFKLCIENNILTTVDLQCVEMAVEKSKTIAEDMRVHINIFPSTIVDTSIEEFIDLFPADGGNHKFCIELSEQHFIIEPKYMRDSITAIQEAGIMVAIDDIGFGRSSLESLILLEPDVVKVDRKYVTGVSDDVGKVRLLRRLTNVAKSLGAEVVAEGIERKDDIPILQDLGVHFGQGFVWGDLMEVLPDDADEQRSLFRAK